MDLHGVWTIRRATYRAEAVQEVSFSTARVAHPSNEELGWPFTNRTNWHLIHIIEATTEGDLGMREHFLVFSCIRP